jgi:CRISPR-associated protein Csx14
VLRRRDKCIVVEHWGDATRRDNVKFWAGSGGYPGAGLARDAQALLPRGPDNIAGDPFAYQAVQTSSFRFDWRRDYVPLDAGFSPNDHGSIVMTGYPAVELLAAIGMSHARPERPDPRNKLEYRYAVPGATDGPLYPPVLLRAALGAGAEFVPGLPLRRFGMFLNWPGQEGQARTITDVVEETEA